MTIYPCTLSIMPQWCIGNQIYLYMLYLHFLATLTEKPLHRIPGGSWADQSVEVVLGIKPNRPPDCLPITMNQLSQLKSHLCIVLLSVFDSPSDFMPAFCGVWRFIALCWNTYYWTFFLLVQQPPVGQGLLIHKVSRSHTTKHHSQ